MSKTCAMPPQPQVTVLIPVYNREQYIAEAIDRYLNDLWTSDDR